MFITDGNFYTVILTPAQKCCHYDVTYIIEHVDVWLKLAALHADQMSLWFYQDGIGQHFLQSVSG